ncbi:MAG TPA: peptidoglycan DD-metalloendopeptidase family protein [Syntrophomonadaceae bacterium]|nr:peptidoglycan DD-metalloendopeptidase family protein [Syntrophomonadaceae bacterium]
MFNYFMQYKRFSPIIIGVLVIGLLGMFVFKTPACSVIVDGQVKFAVTDQKLVNETISEIKKQEERKCSNSLEVASKVEFKKGLVNRSILVKKADLEKELRKNVEFKVLGAKIVIGNKTIACLDCKTSAQLLLKQLKENFEDVDEGEKLIELDFEEKVEIQESMVAVNEIMSSEDAYTLITTGSKDPEKYTVKDGDSLWLIARRNNMYVDEIVQANQLEKEDLSLGQEIILTKDKPFINVVAKVEGEKIEKIPFETKVVVDRSSSSAIKVKQDGKEGEKKIVYVATKKNGNIENREIKEETILEKAVDKIIVKGNQVTVASRGASPGNLDWPVAGNITNRYRGSSHTGIDIATRTGSPIRAVDSGRVTFAGWQGGYGNFVIVDHGNGQVTRYAHCNSINVSTGQNVSRGQNIATVGSTGRSTGPHLHFEVLVNGGFRNPLSYLR